MRLIATILIALTSLTALCQEKRWGVIELSTVYMRSEPDYESALETQELMGTIVEILEEKGYWRKIDSPQPYTAWITEKGLIEMSSEEIEEYMKSEKVIYTGLYGHIHEKPTDKSRTLCDLVGGNVLRITGRTHNKGGWVEVMKPSGQTGWVRSDHIQDQHEFLSIKKGENKNLSRRQKVAAVGESFKLLGVPYLWGGMSSKGVDCSGLVRISYMLNGILLPRNASQQIYCGEEVKMNIDTKYWNEDERMGSEFAQEMRERTKYLEKGDLVFFGTPAGEGKPQRITHVGIYIGNNRIIHSSHLVRVNSLIPSDEDYYENSYRLLAARRL